MYPFNSAVAPTPLAFLWIKCSLYSNVVLRAFPVRCMDDVPEIVFLGPHLEPGGPGGWYQGPPFAHGRSGDRPRAGCRIKTRAEEALDSVQQGLLSFRKSEGHIP